MNLFGKGLKPLTISTALYKSVKTVIKHSMRNCTFTTTIYKTVKIDRFTFVIVRLKAARLVNCTILGGSVFQIFAVLLTLARTGGGQILPPLRFSSIIPEPLKIFPWGKNLFLAYPVPHKVQ